MLAAELSTNGLEVKYNSLHLLSQALLILNRDLAHVTFDDAQSVLQVSYNKAILEYQSHRYELAARYLEVSIQLSETLLRSILCSASDCRTSILRSYLKRLMLQSECLSQINDDEVSLNQLSKAIVLAFDHSWHCERDTTQKIMRQLCRIHNKLEEKLIPSLVANLSLLSTALQEEVLTNYHQTAKHTNIKPHLRLQIIAELVALTSRDTNANSSVVQINKALLMLEQAYCSDPQSITLTLSAIEVFKSFCPSYDIIFGCTNTFEHKTATIPTCVFNEFEAMCLDHVAAANALLVLLPGVNIELQDSYLKQAIFIWITLMESP